MPRGRPVHRPPVLREFLAYRLAGGPKKDPCEWVAEQKALDPDVTWDTLAVRLSQATDWPVSRESLREWCREVQPTPAPPAREEAMVGDELLVPADEPARKRSRRSTRRG